MIRTVSRLLALTLILSSCAINPPVPEDHYYRLPWMHATLPEVRLTGGNIFVAQFIADGLYRERPLIHTPGRSGVELLQYHYHHWIDSPTRMLRDQLIRYLTDSRAAAAVVDTTDVSADIEVHGKIRAFERHEYGNTDRVNVELEFRVDRAGSGIPVLMSAYKVQIDVRDDTMNGVVDAFGVALSQVFAQLLDDANKKLIR